MKSRSVLALAIAALTIPGAHAMQELGHLEKIRKTGAIVIAHRETSVPFSYVGTKGPTGFGTEVALRIAEAVKSHLGLKEIRIHWNPMTLSTRFPLIATNTVDLECSTTTHTRAREAQASFTNTYFISEEVLAIPASSSITSFADLAGKRIAVTRNTSTEKSLKTRGGSFTLMPERTNRDALIAMLEGRADAFVVAQAIIAGELIRNNVDQKVRLIPTGKGKEAFACMLPKGDVEFKKIADQAIKEMMKSGEMARLYDKWFVQPVSPFGKSANLPLDEINKALHIVPNDSPFE